jgi:hypothetical protein
MANKIAGIDVHNKVLMVVVSCRGPQPSGPFDRIKPSRSSLALVGRSVIRRIQDLSRIRHRIAT